MPKGVFWSTKLKEGDDLAEEFQDHYGSFIIAKDVIYPNSTRVKKQYCKFTDAHSIYKNLLSLKDEDQVFYEYMLEYEPRVVYFDLDVDTKEFEYSFEEAELLKDRLIEVVIEEIKVQFSIHVDIEKDLVVFTSHGDKKFSYHILIRSCRMTYKCVEKFCMPIIKQVRKEFKLTNGREVFLDDSVYSRRQAMRVLGSTKLGKTRPKTFNETFMYKGSEINHKYPMEILSVGHKRLVQLTESLISHKGLHEIPEVTIATTEDEVQTVNSETFNVDNLEDILKENPWIKDQFNLRPREGGVYLERKCSGECPACKKAERGSYVHESQNATLVQDKDGNVTYICYQKHATRLRSITPYQGSNKNAFVPYDSGKLPPRFVEDTYDKRYVKPLDAKFKYHIVKANMGTGKTHSVISFIIQEKIQSVVVIAPRQSFAMEMFKRLGDETGLPTFYYSQDGVKVPERGILIVEYESAFKFENVRPFDLLLWDEVTSTSSVISSSTMGNVSRFRNTMNNTELLFQCCKYAVAMDAFIDDRATWLFDKLVPSDEHVLYTHNTCQPNVRNLLVWNDMWIVVHWLSEYVKLGKKIYIPVTSVNVAKRLHKMMEYAGINSLCISGKTSPLEKQKLKDCNGLFQQYQVVIVTSTITVGIDFNVRYFDKIFVFAQSNTGVSARDVLQMIGRIRTVEDPDIFVYCKSARGNRPVSFHTIERRIKDRVDTINMFEKDLKICKPLPADVGFTQNKSRLLQNDGCYKFAYSPTWYSKIHIANLSERGRTSNCYQGEFERLCKKIGYGYTSLPSPDETPQWEALRNSYSQAFDTAKTELDRDDRKTIEQCPLLAPEQVPMLEQKVANGTADDLDVTSLRKYHVSKYFIKPPKFEWFEVFENHKSQCINALITRDSDFAETYPHDQTTPQNPLQPKIRMDQQFLIGILSSLFKFNCIGHYGVTYRKDELQGIVSEISPPANKKSLLDHLCASFEISPKCFDKRFENFPPKTQHVLIVVGKVFSKWTNCSYGIDKDDFFYMNPSHVIHGILPQLKSFRELNRYYHPDRQYNSSIPKVPDKSFEGFRATLTTDIYSKISPDDVFNLYSEFYSGSPPLSKRKFLLTLSKTAPKTKFKGKSFYRLKNLLNPSQGALKFEEVIPIERFC